jgi:hypothetical protein
MLGTKDPVALFRLSNPSSSGVLFVGLVPLIEKLPKCSVTPACSVTSFCGSRSNSGNDLKGSEK